MGENDKSEKSLGQRYRQRFESHRTTGRLLLGFLAFLPISVILFATTGTLIIAGIIPSLALGILIDVFIFGTSEERKQGAKFLGESLIIGGVVFHLLFGIATGKLILPRADLAVIPVFLIMYLMLGGIIVFPLWKLRDRLKKKSNT